MVVWFCLSLEIASLIDLSVQPQSEDEYMLTTRSDAPRKINDSDLLSYMITKVGFGTFLRHEQSFCKGDYLEISWPTSK